MATETLTTSPTIRNGASARQPITKQQVVLPPSSQAPAVTATTLQAYYDAMYERARENVITEITMVTREILAQLLAKNTNNRKPKAKFQEAFCRQLLEHQYQFNGETIVVADTRTVDGQNRLMGLGLAFAKAPGLIAIPMLIVYGVDDDSFKTVDTGNTRSSADYLTLKGEISTHSLSSVLTALHLYEKYGKDWSLKLSYYKVTNADRDETLLRHPRIRESVHAVISMKERRLSYSAAVVLCRYLTTEKHPEEAAAFWDQVLRGLNVQEGSPAHVLQRVAARAGAHGRQLRPSELWVWMTKAWNAHLCSRPIKKLVWGKRADGNYDEIPELL